MMEKYTPWMRDRKMTKPNALATATAVARHSAMVVPSPENSCHQRGNAASPMYCMKSGRTWDAAYDALTRYMPIM